MLTNAAQSIATCLTLTKAISKSCSVQGIYEAALAYLAKPIHGPQLARTITSIVA